MRLPVTPEGAIDEPAAMKLLRAGFEGGINYFDTAWPYHGGLGEEFVGRAVADFRDRITLVTKLPVWLVNEPADMGRFLDKQLAALRTDHLDIYLFHALSAERWARVQEMGALEFMERAKKAGKIRHFGFSFHDGLDSFKKIVDACPWDVCQIQYNLLDRNFQAGTEGLRYAASKDIGVIVMEPLKGGNISRPVPAELAAGAEAAGCTAPTLADLGLRWVWDQPEVSLVLSGMTTAEQLEQNLKSAERGLPGGMTPEERRLADEVQTFLAGHMKVPCTGCAYCMPCPQGLSIPQCFNILNTASLSGKWDVQKNQYQYIFAPERGVRMASACVQCGACVAKCPQHIAIPDRLREVVQAFEG